MSNQYKLKKLVTEDIPSLLDKLGFEDDKYEVTFNYAGYDETLNKRYYNRLTGGSDYCNMISIIMNVKNKETGEFVSSLIPVLKMPVPGELGFQTGKSYKQILDLYKKAPGWYVLPPKKNEDAEDVNLNSEEIKPTLEFSSSYRSKLEFFCKGQEVYFRPDKSGRIPLGTFLKAISGKNELELINLLGSNKYLISSFKDVRSTESCIKATATQLLKNYNKEIFEDTASAFSEIQNKIFKEDIIDADSAGRKRYIINTKFARRAYNKELAEDLTVNGEVIKKGTILSSAILDKIDDNEDITSLSILHNEKTYILKKYPPSESGIGLNEIFTMLNMYLNALDGFEVYEQQYELTSRVLVTYEDNVIRSLTYNVMYLCNDMLGKLSKITPESDIDLRHVMSTLTTLNLDLLVDDIKSVDNVATQVSKNTNIIELTSVNNKVTTDYGGKAAEEAVKVQDTEKGRMDPIHQPESSKIGKVHYKTIHAREDEYGFQVAPYVPVVNCVPDRSRVVYLTAAEENKVYIGEWNETFEKEKVNAYFDGTIVSVDRERVEYIEFSPTQSMSLARSIISFQEFSNAKRLLMGSNHLTQAVPTLKLSYPKVSTGTYGLQPIGVTKAKDILRDYYAFNKSVIRMSEEEFIDLPIVLTRTNSRAGVRSLRFKTNVNGKDIFIDTEIPYMDASDAKSMYTTNVVAKPNHTYQGDDIVTHNMNIKIGIKERELCVDFGSAEPTTFTEDFALGTNLFVGYKTFEGSTIEDAVSIRKSICLDGSLTSISMKDISLKRFNTDEFIEYFSCASEKVEDYMDSTGLPRIGTYLKPGSTVMCKTREDKDGKTIVKRKQLDNNTSGHVIAAYEQGNELIVTLASIDTAEVGDKMSGRHGNKGVIAKVVPDDEMPFCEKTGKILDICLNPLGIPSRMNISQLLEVSLGMCAAKQGQDIVVSPFHPNALEFVKEKREQLGVKPLILRDGRTGELIKRPVECGYLYMLKLEHMAKKKIASVNICNATNKITAQPQKGSGAQSMGEMETWVFAVTGSDKLVQDLLSVQSDDLDALSYLEEMISENPDDIELEGTNNNNVVVQTMLKTLNIDLVNTETGDYLYEPLTDENTRKLASRPLDTSSSSSLSDIDVFGKQLDSNRSRQINKKKFGYIELGCELINPYWLERSAIIKAIPVLVETITDKKEFKDVCKFLGNDLINSLKAKTLVAVPSEIPGICRILKPERVNNDCSVGIQNIVDLLKYTDLDCAVDFITKNANSFDQSRDKILYNRSLLEIWSKDGKSLKDLVITTYPIISPVYRPSNKDENMIHDLETFYTGLFSTVDGYKKNKSDARILAIYEALDRFLGISTASVSDEKKSPLLKSFTGKGKDDKGIIRTQIMAKRCHFSGRSVITPSSDTTMKVDEIGLPILMAVDIWEKHLCAVLSKNSPITEYLPNLEVGKGVQFFKKIITYTATDNVYKFSREMKHRQLDEELIDVKELFYKTKKFIIDWLEQQICIAGRQPSLHAYGSRAYKVRIRTGRTIEVHPLVCKGYNADFDGDTMYVIAVLTNSAKKEVMKTLTVKQSIINPKDSKAIVEHSQDMCLGVYFASMLYDNVLSINEDERYDNGNNVYHFQSLESLKTAIEVSEIELQDLVTVKIDGRNYCSTAGRILFNETIPGGFTDKPFENTLNIPGVMRNDGTSIYNELAYDGLIAKKGGNVGGLRYFGLSDISLSVFEDFDIDTSMKMFQDVMEFGFRYSDLSGISIGVDDVCIDLGTDKYKEQAKARAEELNEAAVKGLISEEGRKRLLIDLYKPLGDYLKEIVNKRLPRNNNLFIIKDSGARGNDDQINQTIGLGGLTMKTLNESHEVPILNSYSQGLTSMEMIVASYGARQGVASTQLGTAEAGYSTRQMVNMLQGLEIVEHDCGVEPTKLELVYDKPIKIVKHYNKNIWKDVVNEEGKTIRKMVGTEPTSEVIKDNANLLAKVIEGNTLVEESDEIDKYLKYFLRHDRKLDYTTIEMAFKKHIRKLVCKECVFEIFYDLDETYADYILNRVTTDKLEGTRIIEGLVEGESIITKATRNYIIENQLTHLNLRTVLDCKCTEGICAKCFGEKFQEKRLPNVGERVGIESAQSIGEPAAQLVMSLFHKGGAAGTSVSSGVTLNNEILKGRLPKKDMKSKHAQMSGYVNVATTGDTSIITLGDQRIVTKTNAVLVKDNEYVNLYEKLTFGLPDFLGLGFEKDCVIYENPKDAILVKATSKKSGLLRPDFDGNIDDLKARVVMSQNKELRGENVVNDIFYEAPNFKRVQRMTILDLYFKTFLNNKISIHARHFELVVRAQSHTIKIINTNVEGLNIGCLYEYNTIQRELANSKELYPYVVYGCSIAKQIDVVALMSGPQAAFAFERALENLGQFTSTRQTINEKGTLGAIVLGEDITKPKSRRKKKLEDFTTNVNSNYKQNIVEVIESPDFDEDVFEQINTNNVKTDLSELNLSFDDDEFNLDLEAYGDDLLDEPAEVNIESNIPHVPQNSDSDYEELKEKKTNNVERTNHNASRKMGLFD